MIKNFLIDTEDKKSKLKVNIDLAEAHWKEIRNDDYKIKIFDN